MTQQKQIPTDSFDKWDHEHKLDLNFLSIISLYCNYLCAVTQLMIHWPTKEQGEFISPNIRLEYMEDDIEAAYIYIQERNHNKQDHKKKNHGFQIELCNKK